MQFLQDGQKLAAAYAQGKDVGDALRDTLPIDRRAPFMSVSTPLDVMKRLQSPEQFVTESRENLKLLVDASRVRLEANKDFREQQVHENTYGEGGNQALVGVEPNLRVPATKEATEAGQDYLQANQMADQVQTMIDLVRSGNKVAGTNIPIMGVEAMNALSGLKRLNRQQVEAYSGAGSLWDKIVGKIGGIAEGKPIPEDLLQDIENFHTALRTNSENGYKTKLQAINQNYHSNFQPVISVPRSVQAALKDKPPSDYQGKDNQWWRKDTNGNIRPIPAPR
jgi:hypothetical protein